MKISIITPVYNSVKTLEQTILSVINQKMESELEYIIVDGGSKDGTLEIINRYSSQIDILISEPDEGVYDAMNKGVKLATGDIIGIINADDWYNDGALQIVEGIFHQEPDISIIYSPTYNYLNGQYLNTFFPGDLKKLVIKFPLNHPSCFVKKTVYDSIGLFDLNYKIDADYDFIFRAYIRELAFRYVEAPLASYSLNGMSGKALNQFKHISESWKVGSKFAMQESSNLVSQRQNYYLYWLFQEVLIFPLKLLINPQIFKKIKTFVRNRIGKLPTDQYGTW